MSPAQLVALLNVRAGESGEAERRGGVLELIALSKMKLRTGG